MKYARCKILLTIGCLLIAMAMQGGSARRSKPNNFHFWSAGFGGGYFTLLEDYPDLNTTGYMGFNAHIGYEYQNQRFWISPMFEVQYLSCNASSATHISDVRILDTQGMGFGDYDEIHLHYDMTSPLKENQRFLYVNVPIMLGFYDYGGFYVGAGLRMGFNFQWVNSRSQINYTTSATYYKDGEPIYYDDFGNMPNHNYTNYTGTNDTVHYGDIFKISVIGEIGYDVMAAVHKSRVKYSGLKIGAFVEYGLNNIINTEGTGEICYINEKNVSQLVPRTYYSTYHTNNHRVVPLYAGIKITFLWYAKKWSMCPRCKRRWY